MSNLHGGEQDEPAGSDAPGNPALAADSDPVTEVIDVASIVEQAGAAPLAGERRYTAPGFDAGSTQIIDRVPDAPTEFIAAGGPHFRPAAPRAIGPRTRRRRWLTPAVLGAAGLLILAVVGTVLFQRSTGPRVSQEERVRTAIQTFDNAIQQGDLATLRTITCGQSRDNYVNYDDKAWADTYSKVLAAKQYPVVASIDEVVVNGDHAEANVTSYMAFDPDTTSTRSFDLHLRNDQWKICQSS